MIVNLKELSETQTWGLKYELQNLNAQTVQQNTQIEQYNATRPINQPERNLLPVMTLQQYADKVLTDRANQAYSSLVSYKQNLAIQLFNNASAEKQAEALAILEVPDVVE